MSRAFVSEDAAAATAGLLPERPVTPEPNPVTPRGLRLIDAEVDRLQGQHSATPTDDPARPSIDRDLRYWHARRLLAQIVVAVPGDPVHHRYQELSARLSAWSEQFPLHCDGD